MIEMLLAGTPLYMLQRQSDSEVELNTTSVRNAKRVIAERLRLYEEIETHHEDIRSIWHVA